MEGDVIKVPLCIEVIRKLNAVLSAYPNPGIPSGMNHETTIGILVPKENVPEPGSLELREFLHYDEQMEQHNAALRMMEFSYGFLFWWSNKTEKG